MSQTYIIGRSGDQPFEIDPQLTFVHGQHARLTADPSSRDWTIEDLKGQHGNGVYVRNADGDFRRVYSCRIRPHDVVRLGPESATSFTFMAQHVLSPQNYNYEFGYIRNLDRHIQAEEEAHSAMVKKHSTISIAVPVCAGLFSLAMRLFIPFDPMLLMGIVPLASSIPAAFFRYKYRGDADQLKAIKTRRAKLLVCPRCNRTLSDYDVRNGRCSACKAM